MGHKLLYLAIIYRYCFIILSFTKSKQRSCILFHRSYECETKYCFHCENICVYTLSRIYTIHFI